MCARLLLRAQAEKDGVGRHFSANKPKSPQQKRAAKHLARLNKQFPSSPVMKGEWRRQLDATAAVC